DDQLRRVMEQAAKYKLQGRKQRMSVASQDQERGCCLCGTSEVHVDCCRYDTCSLSPDAYRSSCTSWSCCLKNMRKHHQRNQVCFAVYAHEVTIAQDNGFRSRQVPPECQMRDIRE
ncbi:unnamed protein product, partial [Rangifer tarandus platyrhynchus]